jgi:hypothetical protein
MQVEAPPPGNRRGGDPACRPRVNFQCRALGVPVNDATPAAADTDPTDPAEPAVDVDVQLGAARLEVRGCGLRPITVGAHVVIRVSDPLGCCVGLDFAGWDYRRDGEALTIRTPDGGVGVRVVRLPLRG